MSHELKDFRGKITTETDCVLEAMTRVTGKDRSEIARDVLHAWAAEQVTMHTVLAQLMRAEGIAGIHDALPAKPEGIAGNKRAFPL